MKLPVCDTCAEGTLCASCESKKQQGAISAFDVTVSKLIKELSRMYPLEDVRVQRAFDAEKFAIILTTSDVTQLIGKEGKVIGELSTRLGKKVRIIEGNDIKKAIADIIAPAKLYGINHVYRSDGTIEYKVRIAKSDMRHLPLDEAVLQRILCELLGSRVTIVFE